MLITVNDKPKTIIKAKEFRPLRCPKCSKEGMFGIYMIGLLAWDEVYKDNRLVDGSAIEDLDLLPLVVECIQCRYRGPRSQFDSSEPSIPILVDDQGYYIESTKDYNGFKIITKVYIEDPELIKSFTKGE
jgi:hypothetical protein